MLAFSLVLLHCLLRYYVGYKRVSHDYWMCTTTGTCRDQASTQHWMIDKIYKVAESTAQGKCMADI